ncbi:hypothetical protein H7849_01510 [Alloacidobacterium dinghuense]|uniref:Uncharacterized protein n=1 Tax=Alloacidobacterium dinghuense TaxID=2763107 RepID=A0A7G8BJK0_9BACT|nr:hypothetical protein [Alloacidobacterium dinghuense]QNI32720.1 hypothetical protein H7849_01510 [Alloacidobacterium dinghuense]
MALIVALPIHGFASPLDSNLLPLVPAGAQIVAGIEDPHNPGSKGRLLLVTHNNNLDFYDWVSLVGVDAHREVDEVIEVAASSSREELTEHLLLVAGRFDREYIFRAAARNGLATSEYEGEKVLLVKPFAREQQEMLDTRWMAILNDRIAIFGTPWLVKKALERNAAHASADTLLLNRLAQLPPDVNSWNVLVMSSPMLARHIAAEQLHAPWAHILDGANDLTVGIHYGPKARVDFALRTDNNPQSAYLASVLAQPHLLQISLSQTFRPQIVSLSSEQRRVQGSITLPGKQFDAWLARVYHSRSPTSVSDTAGAR